MLAIRAEIAKVVVGHKEIVEGVLVCLFAGGHCLLEGVPGLGKTLLIRSLSQALHLKFSRIQFTPDLMPADVTGTTIVIETEHGRDFQFRKGPIFAQIVLADEVNRATPKTQSALLEAMEEHQVTAEGETRPLPEPFFVIATQNPLYQVGTFPLPESQLDRFLMCIELGYPDPASERALLAGKDRRTMLPDGLSKQLAIHLEQVRELHRKDLADGWGRVLLPHALARKYPNAPVEWGWQWVFPQHNRWRDATSGDQGRHHLQADDGRDAQDVVRVRAARNLSRRHVETEKNLAVGVRARLFHFPDRDIHFLQ